MRGTVGKCESYDFIDIIVQFVYNNSEKGRRGICRSQQQNSKNLSKYLSMAETEDIYITKNGHIVAKLCNPNLDRVQMASSLFGAVPDSVTLEEAKTEKEEGGYENSFWIPALFWMRFRAENPFCVDAERIFLAVANHKVEGFLAASSATDIYYLLHKALHDDIKSRKIMDTLFSII